MDAENKAIGESVIFRHALVVRLTAAFSSGVLEEEIRLQEPTQVVPKPIEAVMVLCVVRRVRTGMYLAE